MNINFSKKLLSVFCIFTFVFMIFSETLITYAVSVDYPAELVNIATYGNSKNLTVNKTSDNTPCTLSVKDGSLNEQWRFDYSGTDSKGKYYRIVNAVSGRPLTMNKSKAVIYGNENDKTQYWYVNAVNKDIYDNDLYYCILNYSDNNMALTVSSDDVSVTTYSASDSQKWLINVAGIQGFGGYCKDNDGNEKASVIGGLLGETVEVSTFDELKKACESNEPKTIVITKDISKTGNYTKDGNGRYIFNDARIFLRPDKTIIGGYGTNSLYNVFFRTYEREDYGLGHNFIIKNIQISHDKELNADNIWDFPYGINIWIDHCEFTGHNEVNTASTGLPDWDKFLCIYGNANFATVSDCKFGLHEYGNLFGYPTDNQNAYDTYNNKPFLTISNNYFNDCMTRAPGLLRYGFYHSLNNYVVNFDMGYTVYTACKLFAENCYYDGGTRKGSVVNDRPGQGADGDISGKYLGSYAETGSKLVNSNFKLEASYAKTTDWRPSSNYSYKAMSADDAKSYCINYSGSQDNKSYINYSVYSNAGVPSAGFTEGSDGSGSLNEDTEPVTMNIDRYYKIKNVNSGMYLNVNESDSNNVCQLSSDITNAENVWRLVLAGDKYYYLQSMTGDKISVLDVSGGKSDNGTNIAIYPYRADNKNQHFAFTENSDGSYKIRTRVSGNKSCVEVINADKTSGANVQEWESNGVSCQDWILEEVEYSGEMMDTSKNYMFKNSGSGLYMEVQDGVDADGQNIQQWGADKSMDSNSWTLKPMNNTPENDLYYIVSNLGEHRYININNGNAELKARDSKTNTQLVRFVKNPDGTYNIVTRVSYNKTSKVYTSGLEVANADNSSGANIQQYTLNGNACQNWIAETFTVTTSVPTTVPNITTTTVQTTESSIIWGDANDDGIVDVADVVSIASYVGNPEANKLTENGLKNADVHGNGNGIDATDALTIQQYLAKILIKLPV